MLVDDDGYLIAADFGSSKFIEDSDVAKLEWQTLGLRVGDYAFRLRDSESDIGALVRSLVSGQITSLTDLKQEPAFKDFDWEALNTRQLVAPFLEIRKKLTEKFYALIQDEAQSLVL